ncbi:MAG: glycoside hydrolase family 113 [Sulfobacillus sp.]
MGWRGSSFTIVLGILGAGLAVQGCGPLVATPLPPAHAFMKGMTEAGYSSNVFESATMQPALEELHRDGVDWVSIQVGWYQNTDTSTHIFPDPKETPTDASLVKLIRLAHQMGMRVFLDPFINANRGNAWQADFEPTSVSDWFHSYDQYLIHYAQIAQAQKVDLLAIGDEFDTLDDVPSFQPYWIHAIQLVHRYYKGPVTYGADYVHYRQVTFWNQLNVVGLDAYFPLSNAPHPSIAVLSASWRTLATQIARWRKNTGLNKKPFVVTELGYYSGQGAAAEPGTWTPSTPVDLALQARLYQATFQSLYREPMVSGLFWFWWANPSNPDWLGGPRDNGYTPRNKPAEAVLRQFFNKPRQPFEGSTDG